MDNSIKEALENELLKQYLDAVLDVNKYLNLTRVTEENDARLLHLEDSLTILPEINAAPDGPYGDLGSGGGFPGVPIGISTRRETVLIDSVKKKMKAVQDILDELNIRNISTCDLRIEELAQQKPKSFSVLSARALSSLPSLLELSSPLLRQGGQLIAMKSKRDESFSNKALEKKLGMKLVDHREFMLSDDKTYRSVFVFEKYKEPDIKLPRRLGMAQKNPFE